MVKYNSQFQEHGAERTIDFSSIISPALDHLYGDLSDQRLLDVGCGTGKYAREASRRGAVVTGLDVRANQIEVAREKSRHATEAINYVIADICSSAFEPASFDIVQLMFVVLDISTESMLSDIIAASLNTLKSGGRFIIADVHPHNFNRENTVEWVRPVENPSYFRVANRVNSRVKMFGGGFRDFHPTYHYPLSFLVNAIISKGALLRTLIEPEYEASYPTHMLLEFLKVD